MTGKGIKTTAYLIKSHAPWMPGKLVITPIPLPGWNSSCASIANMAILRVINNAPR